MEHDDNSPIDASAVRSHLEERVQAGRTAGEAAGEILFAKDKQFSMGALSGQSRTEFGEIVEEWLKEATDVSMLTAHRSIAKLYAQFLTERVSWDLSQDVNAQIDSAWQEWRSLPKTNSP